jgi:hypothetical protein
VNAQDGLPACESEASRLLPWFVTGRLAADDQQRVARHLEQCALCRADLEQQRSLRALIRAEPTVELAPQAGLARTLGRIDELERELAREPAGAVPVLAPGNVPAFAQAAAPTGARTVAPRWLLAAVVVQALLLCGLGARALLGSRTPPATYQTLSTADPAAVGARVRVVFDAAMPVGELHELLANRGLLLVDGPSEAGVFTLRPLRDSGIDIDAAARALRADHRVLFAESVGAVGAGATRP